MKEEVPAGRKPDLAAEPRWEEAVAAAGIEPRYVDAHGRTVTIDRESALRLLDAMRVGLEPDPHRIEQPQRRHALPSDCRR